MPQGILAYQAGIEPATPAREGEVLTTGPPGKPLPSFLEYAVKFRSYEVRGKEKKFLG